MTAALDHYTGPSEFDGMLRQAEVLAKSNLVPKAFRGKPADIVVAAMLGRELDLGPMATMSYVDVIEGNATLNAEGKVALVRRAGHSINGEAGARKAVARGRRRDTGDEMAVEWTLEMAARAGLASKAVWKQYPESMLWSRAVSQLCRMLFPDVLVGLSYTPEEVEAFTGVDYDTGEIRGGGEQSFAPPSDALPAPASSEPEPITIHRNERAELLELRGIVKEKSDKKLLEVIYKEWADAGLGSIDSITPEQLHTAQFIFRKWAAILLLTEAGVKESERHATVLSITEGATESTKELSGKQFEAIRAYCSLLTEDAERPFTDEAS